MHRFHLPPDQCREPILSLAGREAHHALHVLRVRRGESVAVLDGAGREFLCEVPVSFVQAALGDEIDVPALDGKATLKIPSGTQPGTMFRLKGKGVRNIQGYGTGDLHVRINVEVPTQLSSAQKTKLQEFASLCNGKESPLSQSFFEKARKLFKGEGKP